MRSGKVKGVTPTSNATEPTLATLSLADSAWLIAGAAITLFLVVMLTYWTAREWRSTPRGDRREFALPREDSDDAAPSGERRDA